MWAKKIGTSLGNLFEITFHILLNVINGYSNWHNGICLSLFFWEHSVWYQLRWGELQISKIIFTRVTSHQLISSLRPTILNSCIFYTFGIALSKILYFSFVSKPVNKEIWTYFKNSHCSPASLATNIWIIFGYHFQSQQQNSETRHNSEAHISPDLWFHTSFLYLQWKSADMTKHFILHLNPFSTRRFAHREAQWLGMWKHN